MVKGIPNMRSVFSQSVWLLRMSRIAQEFEARIISLLKDEFGIPPTTPTQNNNDSDDRHRIDALKDSIVAFLSPSSKVPEHQSSSSPSSSVNSKHNLTSSPTPHKIHPPNSLNARLALTLLLNLSLTLSPTLSSPPEKIPSSLLHQTLQTLFGRHDWTSQSLSPLFWTREWRVEYMGYLVAWLENDYMSGESLYTNTHTHTIPKSLYLNPP
jgi:hypothetical protein